MPDYDLLNNVKDTEGELQMSFTLNGREIVCYYSFPASRYKHLHPFYNVSTGGQYILTDILSSVEGTLTKQGCEKRDVPPPITGGGRYLQERAEILPGSAWGSIPPQGPILVLNCYEQNYRREMLENIRMFTMGQRADERVEMVRFLSNTFIPDLNRQPFINACPEYLDDGRRIAIKYEDTRVLPVGRTVNKGLNIREFVCLSYLGPSEGDKSLNLEMRDLYVRVNNKGTLWEMSESKLHKAQPKYMSTYDYILKLSLESSNMEIPVIFHPGKKKDNMPQTRVSPIEYLMSESIRGASLEIAQAIKRVKNTVHWTAGMRTVVKRTSCPAASGLKLNAQGLPER